MNNNTKKSYIATSGHIRHLPRRTTPRNRFINKRRGKVGCGNR